MRAIASGSVAFLFMTKAPALYGSKWQKARESFLRLHPLCQCPRCEGGVIRVRAASVVDHKVPHRGDMKLFWDRKNWQALAKQCHDSWKQRLEKSGTVIGANELGLPIDPNHHWNKARVG